MNVTIEGADRSSDYQPSEFDAITIELSGDMGASEPGQGSLPVPSTDMTEEAYIGQQALLESDGETMLDGFIGAMNRDRNGVAVGPRQVFHYTLLDENALLGGHRAYKWVRPAETDRVRMLAAIDEFLGHLSLDTTWVLNTHNEDLPAKTYITEDIFGELQNDCGDPTAKTMFIHERAFHWHRQTEGITAGITIVDPADADGITKFALIDAQPPQRSKDAADLALDVLASNDAGQTYQTDDPTLIGIHDAAGMRHERLIEGGSRTLAQITTMADRLLATYKVERVTYSGTIGPLTAAQAKMLPPGGLVTVTNAVWGLTTDVQRIGSISLRYRHPDKWFADVELGYKARLRVRPIKETSKSSIGSGEQTDGGPDCCPPFVCDGNDYAVHTTNGSAVMSVVFPSHINGQSATSDAGVSNADAMYVYNGATYGLLYLCYHAPGPDPVGSNMLNATLLNVTTGLPIGNRGAHVVGSGIAPWVVMGDIRGPDGCSFNPPSDIPIGETEWTADFTGYVLTSLIEDSCLSGDSYASSLSTHITYLRGPDPRFELLGPCTNGLPNTNQQVVETPVTGSSGSGAPGDGVTTTGSTDHGFAYVPGSLRIEVNGLDWTKNVTETDPTAGTYDYLYAPPLGATIQVIHNFAGLA